MHFTGEVGGQVVPVEVRAEKGRYVVLVGDRRLELDVCRTGPGFWSVLADSRSYDIGIEKANGYTVRLRGSRITVRLTEGTAAAAPRTESGPARILSPMPGKVVRVLVTPGQAVVSGAPLVVVEAMKMENELRATRDGEVSAVHVREGQAVDGGTLLLELR